MKSVGEVLELYDGDKRLAYLLNATSIVVKESLNGEYYVQFVYPRQEDDLRRYGLLKEQLDIVFPDDVERGQRFTIRSAEEVRQGKKIYKVVEAHHVAFNLGGYFFDGHIDFAATQSLEDMLTLLGADTPYSFVIEGSFEPQDVWDWGEKRKIDLLHELRELYSAELAFDNYTITLTTRKGDNHGALIQYKHNMKGIKRKSHDMERITRLYGYGKNGLTIEGYSGHTVKYIDSEYFDPIRPLMGKVEFPEVETQVRLLQEMQKHLRKYELPNVSYDVEFVQLEKVDREHIDDKIHGTGDTVTVRDAELGYLFEARVYQFERYPFDKKSGRAVLSNFRELKTSDYIFQATVGSKKALSFTNKNAVLKGVKYDDSITLVDGMGMAVSDELDRIRVRLGQVGPGDYGFTAYNKVGNRTIWLDAATGDGRFSGRLMAASGSFSGSLYASYFEAGEIEGSVITGSLIQSALANVFPRAEMSNTANMFKVEASGDSRIEVSASGSPITSPSLYFKNGNQQVWMSPSSNPTTGLYIGGPALTAELDRINLRGYTGVFFLNWSSIRSEGMGGGVNQSLQQALDSLSSRITALGG